MTVVDSSASLCTFCVCQAVLCVWVFLSKILSKFLSVSWLRTSASSCVQDVQMYKCTNVNVKACWKRLVLWFCCVPVMCVKEVDEDIYKRIKQVRVSLQLRPGVHPRGYLAGGFISSLLPQPVPNALCCNVPLRKISNACLKTAHGCGSHAFQLCSYRKWLLFCYH